MTAYTLFGQSGGGSSVGDQNSYTMGVQFEVSVACILTGIWFYSAAGSGTDLPGTIALYQVSGTSLVHSEAASWSGAGASGWIRAAFTSPPSLSPSTSYKACVFLLEGTPTVSWYSATAHYWDTGAGASGITNGPLSAPANAGGDGGQDTFNSGGSLAYPSGSFNAANYWVDPEVVPSGGGGGSFRPSLLLASFP